VIASGDAPPRCPEYVTRPLDQPPVDVQLPTGQPDVRLDEVKPGAQAVDRELGQPQRLGSSPAAALKGSPGASACIGSDHWPNSGANRASAGRGRKFPCAQDPSVRWTSTSPTHSPWTKRSIRPARARHSK
jgi:hypothetical protein